MKNTQLHLVNFSPKRSPSPTNKVEIDISNALQIEVTINGFVWQIRHGSEGSLEISTAEVAILSIVPFSGNLIQIRSNTNER